MSEVLPGDGWWAAIEGIVPRCPGDVGAPEEDQAKLRYARVVAWERWEDKGKPAMRAWINGKPPVASDVFSETAKSYFINHYTKDRPEDSKEFNWS